MPPYGRNLKGTVAVIYTVIISRYRHSTK